MAGTAKIVDDSSFKGYTMARLLQWLFRFRFKYDVFLSYARRDGSAYTRLLRDELRRVGNASGLLQRLEPDHVPKPVVVCIRTTSIDDGDGSTAQSSMVADH